VDRLTDEEADCSNQDQQFQVEVFNMRYHHFAICLLHRVAVHYNPVTLYFTKTPLEVFEEIVEEAVFDET